MSTIHIEIDGKRIEAQPEEMLIAVSDRAGIYIPRFCYHEELSIAANCRMCLVEVEKAPKPLPACATPVSDGMKVFTRSKLAREAQQGTLEFLLINHPLDCPVCDQGGECPLQDQAMGYGNDDSRFDERKRVVPSHDIGPLVATEMTRCIHCTRCVRFGEEVAGMMEMGFPGRGEAAYIATFLNRTLDSEVSGNMIDLCPVGALTSKPYRFAARSWELENHRGISPHDCLGTNLNVQTLRKRVERVLPRDNPKINACWLADRDRYSYEAIYSEQRLQQPMIKESGKWRETTWEEALNFACAGLKDAMNSGDDLGVLAGYTSTLEEYYLLQKLARALDCNHVDHRMQQHDFRDDEVSAEFPASELPIHEYDNIHAALLVGSNIRKEQPLLALRLRAAALNSAHENGNGARISSINPLAYQQNFPLQTAISAGAELPGYLAAVAERLAKDKKVSLPADITPWTKTARPTPTDSDLSDIVTSLIESGVDGVVIVGALAQQHRDASVIKGIAHWICKTTGNRLAILPPGNSVAAWRAGCLPHRTTGGAAVEKGGEIQIGHTAATMLENPRRAYLLLATEPELDSVNGKAAHDALESAKFVVRITAYKNEYADVLLPMSAFAESAGSFINCTGDLQQAEAATSPQGESRPAWKILRVLGNFFDLPGFDYVSLNQVTEEINLAPTEISATMNEWEIPPPAAQSNEDKNIQRLLDIPIYRGDQIVRNAPALQRTADNPPPMAHMNQATIEKFKLSDSEPILMKASGDEISLPLQADERIPNDCVYVPAGYIQTAPLGNDAWLMLKKG